MVNDTGDVGKAVGSGVPTGFTFGLVGSSSTDHYIMTVQYRAADGREIRREYQHDLLVLNMLGDLEGLSAIAGLNPNER